MKSFVLLGCLFCVVIGNNAMAACGWSERIDLDQSLEEFSDVVKRYRNRGFTTVTSISLVGAFERYIDSEDNGSCNIESRARFNIKYAIDSSYRCESVIEVVKEEFYHGDGIAEYNYTIMPIDGEGECLIILDN